MNFTKDFLESTAKDYDMSLHKVIAIAEKYPEEEFYDHLEAELVEDRDSD